MLRKLIPGVLVLLFMYTGFSKVFALTTFKGTLYNQPIPHWLATPLIVLIPATEIFTAIGLLFDKTRRPALFSALILLVIFTAYIGVILLHLFHKTPCSCGGIFRGLSWTQHFWVNIGLTALAAVAIFIRNKKSIPSPINLQV
jgi:putative oxidoreductase